jgi:small subunit ribosomal protein S6
VARIQTPAHLTREFECVYLIRQDVEDPAADKIIEKYRSMVEENGGKVVKLDSWGKRKLAYPINKQQKAHYVYMEYFGTESMVAEIERSMRLSEEVVRWMTVLRDGYADPESRPKAGEINRRHEPEADESRPEGAAPRPPRHDDDDDQDTAAEA